MQQAAIPFLRQQVARELWTCYPQQLSALTAQLQSERRHASVQIKTEQELRKIAEDKLAHTISSLEDLEASIRASSERHLIELAQGLQGNRVAVPLPEDALGLRVPRYYVSAASRPSLLKIGRNES